MNPFTKKYKPVENKEEFVSGLGFSSIDEIINRHRSMSDEEIAILERVMREETPYRKFP